MKGRYLLFAVCLGWLGLCGVRAEDDTSAARAAARRVAAGTISNAAARGKSASADTAARPSGKSARGDTSVKTSASAGRSIGARTTALPDTARPGADATSPRTTVTGRTGTAATVQARPVASTARTATSTVARTALPVRGTTVSARTATGASRNATPIRARTATGATVSRAATTNTELREKIMGRDYKTCREVYYECMDEFCANKDAQLKRCACSSRLHDFDKVKQSLTNVEDKLLDFNQRLLTVNMDKEDAEALFTATEGELAFNKKDTSDSKKILDEIAKKLNSGGDDAFSQNLSAISLSLNTDAAFDSVDSLMGASTTAKEGVALYNAALPVCREMAAEVCDEEALAIAESGYQMTIEQDCNTIAKTYETQADQAREKIREGGALLDISRLDIYQKRNSDDILTCKKKMLTQLADTSVCGENLSKCLDMSGQYIDPSTGQAFLTENLANLSLLITRPTGNQTWTSAPGNDRFITYLNSKKKYLEPAMENCQDIADDVWDMFIEDALAQIKLAQDAKLEEVRQSCTTLTAQCLTDTAKSIADFDARALSTFGVKADKTVNDMCASVRTACTALLDTIGGADDWVGGMTQIATDKTYETIMQTCREVGRACIIQTCKSISGNFGMCENIQNSVNRKAIINHTACWDDVKQCVAEAGEDAINRIFEQIEKDAAANGGSFYTELYGTDFTDLRFTNNSKSSQFCYQEKGTKIATTKTPICIYDMCETDCGCTIDTVEKIDTCSNINTLECRVCRLAEKIWGNCEAKPSANIRKVDSHNQILIPKNPKDVSTLLSWFAENTGTADNPESCRDTTCPSGYVPIESQTDNIICIDAKDFTSDGNYCPSNKGYRYFKPFGNNSNVTNCCSTGGTGSTEGTPGAIINNWCCIGAQQSTQSNDTVPTYGTMEQNYSVCAHNENQKANNVVGELKVSGISNMRLVCMSANGTPVTGDDTTDPKYPGGKKVKCDGTFVYVDSAGHHIDPHTSPTSYMSYTTESGTVCKYPWTDAGCQTPQAWMVQYPTPSTP